jgi:hypothetical protein
LLISPAAAEPVGSTACRACHLEISNAQAKSAHATALSKAGEVWNFGSGVQAVTPVSRIGTEEYKEHGITKYKSGQGITPGHGNGEGVVYKVFDPGGQILRCFQCHSTGKVSFTPEQGIQPSELGVRCESCHGPGGDHAKAPSKFNIFQPRNLNGDGVNAFCGNCHRQPPKEGQDTNFADPWNVRHQPVYLSQSKCFLASEGKLTCMTCHDPHGAKPTRNACGDCHSKPRHRTVKSGTCSGCHMPAVAPSKDLKFTNHWIGIHSR